MRSSSSSTLVSASSRMRSDLAMEVLGQYRISDCVNDRDQ